MWSPTDAPTETDAALAGSLARGDVEAARQGDDESVAELGLASGP
jgi:hypothetical protein